MKPVLGRANVLDLDAVCDISDDLGLSFSLPLLGEPPDKVLAQIPYLDHRASDLVVVRESDESDHILMQGCIQHTLSHCTALPGYQQACELGIGPLLRPDDYRDRLPVIEIRYQGSRAVLFLVGSTYFLYSEGSAAKANRDGDNNFTMILIATAQRLRPRALHVVALSRLVRSFEHSGLVQSAVTRHVDVVHNGGMPMVMRGEGQEIGQLMWSTLASISASERNLILQRLTAGVVAKHARGEWTLGKHAIPLGYRLSATGALELDESQAEAVALAWNLLANPWVSLRRVVQELGALGVSSHNLRRTYGPEATVADMAQPKNFVNRMVRYATLHVTGRHTQLLANPFPGATHLASLPVHPPTHERPNGHVKFPFEPGVPSAGWADQRVIEEAIRVRTGARDLVVTERTSPLSSAAWSDGEVAYRIHRTPDGTYAVRGIPLEWTEQ